MAEQFEAKVVKAEFLYSGKSERKIDYYYVKFDNDKEGAFSTNKSPQVKFLIGQTYNVFDTGQTIKDNSNNRVLVKYDKVKDEQRPSSSNGHTHSGGSNSGGSYKPRDIHEQAMILAQGSMDRAITLFAAGKIELADLSKYARKIAKSVIENAHGVTKALSEFNAMEPDACQETYNLIVEKEKLKKKE